VAKQGPDKQPNKAPRQRRGSADASNKAQQRLGSADASNKAPQQRRGSADASQAPMVRAKARYVRVAPRKARLIADQVRGMPVEEARTLLAFSSRGAAQDVARLIDSAAANAEANHELVADELRIADIRVDEGPTLKRWRARARGRATPIHKKTSHLSVALTPTPDA